MARDNDLVLIGFGIGTWGPRRATEAEVAAHESSKTTEFKLDPEKTRKAQADKARLDALTGRDA